MSETGMTGTGDQAAGGETLSRRRVLQVGLAAIPALCGARLLSAAVGAPADAASAAEPAPIAAAYDPTAHSVGLRRGHEHLHRLRTVRRRLQAREQRARRPGVLADLGREPHALTDGRRRSTSTRPTAGATGSIRGGLRPVAPGATVTDVRFVPRLCMQCENSPCTAVCPVGATFRTADGVVLVDEERCIGCGYCVVACPYGARYIVPAGGDTPRGVPGVADKCTFCYHRITTGQASGLRRGLPGRGAHLRRSQRPRPAR